MAAMAAMAAVAAVAAMAEADGNRTRQRQFLPLYGFEDRAGHQAGYASPEQRAIIER